MRRFGLLLLCLAAVVLGMGAYGGSEKARIDHTVIQYNNTSYGGIVSISATWPCTVTDADIAMEAFELGDSSAFSMIATITNSSSASASLKLQVQDPESGAWKDQISTTTGAASAMTVLTFTGAVDGWCAISSLPVGRKFRFVAIHDATHDEYAITRLVVLRQ